MKKTTTQLLIAGGALAAALALAAYAAPSCAAECPKDALTCQPAVKPWHKFITDNDGTEFMAAWIAADEECKGETRCIENQLKEQGWTWETGR
jgi:hypothetical protein